MKRITLLLCLCLVSSNLVIQAYDADNKPMKKDADVKIYFIELNNGQTVSKTFTVKFGLEGFGIAPAGTDKENTGHHHLLIDTKELPDLSKMLPATDKIIHFGGGQTETELTLEPGKHTLQLLLGDYQHIAHAKPIFSKKITIIVKE
ncbi:MAG: rod shape-determining protein RodA [Gammaproteobacteria bacterium]|nr:MAG: rod shape-determining protein RodA [Gammaproteobacteria bacterium]